MPNAQETIDRARVLNQFEQATNAIGRVLRSDSWLRRVYLMIGPPKLLDGDPTIAYSGRLVVEGRLSLPQSSVDRATLAVLLREIADAIDPATGD